MKAGNKERVYTMTCDGRGGGVNLYHHTHGGWMSSVWTSKKSKINWCSEILGGRRMRACAWWREISHSWALADLGTERGK